MTNLLSNLFVLWGGNDSLHLFLGKTSEEWIQDGFNLMALLSFFVGACALYYTRKTVLSIKTEAENDRIDKECQRRLFCDIIRHLYRNKICTMAMWAKYLKEGEKGYPSDEHFLKLQLLPSDIHLEQYYKNPEMYSRLHNVELLLRNYNTEIEVAQMHVSNKLIDKDTKNRDFKTLDFKPGYLTYKIIEVMNVIWKGLDNNGEAKKVIREMHANNLKENPIEKWNLSLAELLNKELEKKGGNQNGDWYFKVFAEAECDEVKEMLDKDLAIECGLNSKDEEKIHIIKF